MYLFNFKLYATGIDATSLDLRIGFTSTTGRRPGTKSIKQQKKTISTSPWLQLVGKSRINYSRRTNPNPNPNPNPNLNPSPNPNLPWVRLLQLISLGYTRF